MNSTGGYVYFLHGADTYGRDESARALKDRMRALPAGEHNLTELRGPDATVRALKEAADVVPFLADRRMIIAYGLLDRLLGGQAVRRRAGRGSRAAAAPATSELEDLLAYLPRLPFTTTVVFVDGPSLNLEPLVQVVPAGRALTRPFPAVEDVGRWVRKQARGMGLELDESAVRELARLGGDDLRRLDGELRKLAAYVGGQTATRDDVNELVVARDVTTWALLDALVERRADAALRALRLLSQQGEPPEALLGRDVIPLYRRLVAAKELLNLGRQQRSAVDMGQLGLNPRTLPRLSEQVTRFATDELYNALDLLLDLDRAIKTGEIEPDCGLELAIVQLCSRLGSATALRGRSP